MEKIAGVSVTKSSCEAIVVGVGKGPDDPVRACRAPPVFPDTLPYTLQQAPPPPPAAATLEGAH